MFVPYCQVFEGCHGSMEVGSVRVLVLKTQKSKAAQIYKVLFLIEQY